MHCQWAHSLLQLCHKAPICWSKSAAQRKELWLAPISSRAALPKAMSPQPCTAQQAAELTLSASGASQNALVMTWHKMLPCSCVKGPADLDDLAKLPKVLVCFEQVLIAQLQGKPHHIDQIPLDDSHILRACMPSVVWRQACTHPEVTHREKVMPSMHQGKSRQPSRWALS